MRCSLIQVRNHDKRRTHRSMFPDGKVSWPKCVKSIGFWKKNQNSKTEPTFEWELLVGLVVHRMGAYNFTWIVLYWVLIFFSSNLGYRKVFWLEFYHRPSYKNVFSEFCIFDYRFIICIIKFHPRKCYFDHDFKPFWPPNGAEIYIMVKQFFFCWFNYFSLNLCSYIHVCARNM